ncbi:BMP family ABC transporter substrate-binding protein [Cytobacillus spongiae]|uniref:BMP family ABC transporter substrate-binding protein n=1 Tax=Cytobacillus spongiae TaxID=2901381 RepID=UPI001F3D7916|nr:BMP family ABC transporter substrate-binding protein [Cytobacillus spongiae]UII57001.1 BMP family ABC transporter substrate-binding protein [Cytobacillus spongiae]
MHRILYRSVFVVMCLLLVAACGQPMSAGNIKKVGLLVPETVNDQVWGTKGYKGLLKIQSKFDVDVYYKEGINTQPIAERAIREYAQKGVNLIFGHGNEYAVYFNAIADDYPDIHFVSFNGNATKENTTSLNFKAYAMGFFGGMVAANMSNSERVGIIAAYEWQPEIEGFYDGAFFENENVNVDIQYVGHWDHDEKALQLLDNMLENEIDVVYPAGDGYNVPVIEKVKENGLYAIGYISDQSDLGKSTVLTSTIQHVDTLYEVVAEKFQNGDLDSGNLFFDFQDDVISLGEFSPDIDYQFKEQINQYIQVYKETGQLPNE